MEEPHIIQLPKIPDRRGNLSFIEQQRHIPFGIRRAYWIYDVPGGEGRGSHAYRRNREFIVALSGSFDVILTRGDRRLTFTLNRSYYGLYIPRGWWREMNNFSTNSLAFILGSEPYDPEDYIRDFGDFQKYIADGEAQ